MNKSQKILFNDSVKGNNMHFKVKLEQNVNNVQFLSMDVSTEDVYQDFNSDYGVLVGRVIANDGIGIPNAKISVFIPLSDDDSTDSEISSIYPYKTPREKNNEGKRYNLLPRVSKIDPITNQWKPKQPFGSLPIKEEIITNPEYLDVYKKYYKYTALTNNAGDYMIFGVPIGTQTVHLSVDITDIGEYSMNPASMVVNLGYSANLFTDNNTKIKESKDLNDLPNIETQEISVEIIPFWGDAENFEIGITRQDFRIRSVLNKTFVLFGTSFTDGNDSMWGHDYRSDRSIREFYRIRPDWMDNLGMATKRTANVTESIYYYPPEISDETIDGYSVDPINQMRKLDSSEYTVHKRNGDFVYILSCNRNRVITGENGEEVPVPYDSNEGVFTEFRGFVVLEIEDSEAPMEFSSKIGTNAVLKPYRYKLKFPQHAGKNQSFEPTESRTNDNWRNENFKFEGGKIYSFSRFNGIIYNNGNTSDVDQYNDYTDNFFGGDRHNYLRGSIETNVNNVGIIMNSSFTYDDEYYNHGQYEFPTNCVASDGFSFFGGNWMNLCVHFPQLGFLERGSSGTRDTYTADHFARQKENDEEYNSFYLTNNSQDIVGGYKNTKFFARADFNWTDIIEVPITDINLMIDESKGFIDTGSTVYTGSTYRNGINIPDSGDWVEACPFDGGKINCIPTNPVDPNTYFYKGYDESDCIQYLIDLGIVDN